MDLKAVRRQLLAMRQEKNYSQEEVAEDAGVSQATISRLEDLSVEMQEIEFETIRKIVERGLNVTLSSFFAHIERSEIGRSQKPALQTLDKGTHNPRETSHTGHASSSLPAPDDLQSIRDALSALGDVLVETLGPVVADRQQATARHSAVAHRRAVRRKVPGSRD